MSGFRFCSNSRNSGGNCTDSECRVQILSVFFRCRHGSGNIFARRADFSVFNVLPKTKINSYHIKVRSLKKLNNLFLRVLLVFFEFWSSSTTAFNDTDPWPVQEGHRTPWPPCCSGGSLKLLDCLMSCSLISRGTSGIIVVEDSGFFHVYTG